MKENKAITYSLLAHIRNTGTLMKGPIDAFVPLIKRALHQLNEQGISKGQSILEIQRYASEIYSIDFPLPVLKSILKKIESEVNEGGVINFQLFNDNSFLLKEFYFVDYEESLQESKRDVTTIEKLFLDFLKINNIEPEANQSVLRFIEKNKMSISRYISNIHVSNGTDYTIEAKFVDFFKKIPHVYEIIKRLYLGSIITGFLEFKTDSYANKVELLLDTNFVVSLLDLNTPESTHTCNKLLEVCRNIGYNFSILSDTIDEIKFLLKKKAENFSNTFLGKRINPEDIYNACERRRLNGSDLERIVDNIEDLVHGEGINIIPHTEKWKNIAKFSKEFNYLKDVRNSKVSALHDATAIFYVREKRGKPIRDFEKVNCWFVNNSFSQTSLSNEGYIEFQNESIRADELLNILWLSNPGINRNSDNDDFIDIGLTSIVAFTLSRSLPKASIIRELDDNIQKYRDESISDKDIILISTRISNRQLKDIEGLNKLAETSKEEFVIKLKDEANKQLIEENNRIEKLDGLLQKFQLQVTKVGKERLRLKQKNEHIDKQELSYQAKTSELELKLANERKEKIIAKNKLIAIARNAFISKKVKKWRLQILIPFLAAAGIALIGILILLSSNQWNFSELFNNIEKIKKDSLGSLLMAMIGPVIFAFFMPVFILRFFNVSNIEAFKKTITIPSELMDEEL
ncbi:hypothetical protein [Dyadobacter fanqingshengii]|uniref:PIN domain-containing protein n=1 Tax=Dyadobacter fanqingshengii TaxID=2906443 RepID=A0A9X1P6M5_9BACT|nr:hypothetical protein [Dyadobacter fanqingshengii]MCF0038980.1 hypothetical protein [Dyadobacter fanqingshengii]USJ34198.1 hypothetical protein NFI81_15940 [Dyadobacter fanqingshengii]